jgi:hypothetical protein
MDLRQVSEAQNPITPYTLNVHSAYSILIHTGRGGGA